MTENTSERWVCPKCKTECPNRWGFCGRCGTARPAPAVEMSEDERLALELRNCKREAMRLSKLDVPDWERGGIEHTGDIALLAKARAILEPAAHARGVQEGRRAAMDALLVLVGKNIARLRAMHRTDFGDGELASLVSVEDAATKLRGGVTMEERRDACGPAKSENTPTMLDDLNRIDDWLRANRCDYDKKEPVADAAVRVLESLRADVERLKADCEAVSWLDANLHEQLAAFNAAGSVKPGDTISHGLADRLGRLGLSERVDGKHVITERGKRALWMLSKLATDFIGRLRVAWTRAETTERERDDLRAKLADAERTHADMAKLLKERHETIARLSRELEEARKPERSTFAEMAEKLGELPVTVMASAQSTEPPKEQPAVATTELERVRRATPMQTENGLPCMGLAPDGQWIGVHAANAAARLDQAAAVKAATEALRNRVAELERLNEQSCRETNRVAKLCADVTAERDANSHAARELEELRRLVRELDARWVFANPSLPGGAHRFRELLHLDQPAAKPETDDKHRGIYRKYRVERTDGSSAPGGKHEDCEYFVLDWEHDKYSVPAMRAYADACSREFPELARDVRAMANEHDKEKPETVPLVESAEVRDGWCGWVVEFARPGQRDGNHGSRGTQWVIFPTEAEARTCARVLSEARVPVTKEGGSR